MAGLHTLSGIYQGGFADTINKMCSPANIKQTAAAFQKLDKDHTYEFGNFAQQMIADRKQWGPDDAYDRWQGDVAAIPESLRQRLTDVVRANMWSSSPLPMLLQVGDNIDQTHDLIIRVFAYKGTNYIGILMLCPNPKLSG